ncbi:hypothetical protein Tco_0471680 [Tanacetum coccineum]
MSSPDFSKGSMNRFNEAWDRYHDLLRACSTIHGFSRKLHQLDTFYNALNSNDKDSFELRTQYNSSSPRAVQPDVANLRILSDNALRHEEQASAPLPAPAAPVKAVVASCVTCVVPILTKTVHATTHGNVYRDNISEYVHKPLSAIQPRSGTLPGNTLKLIPEVTKDQVHPSCSQSTAPVQPPVGPEPITTPVLEPIVAPVVAPVPNTKPSVSLPYPSRRDNEKSRNQANEQIDKFYEIFKEMIFTRLALQLLLFDAKIPASDSKNLLG